MKPNKYCIQQVIGGLIIHPQFLSEVDKYNLDISDFSNRFEKCIFTAVQSLYYNGVEKINPIDIEKFLESDVAALELFKQSNGLDYLQDAIELSNIENFQYYYTKLKKLNLLKDLEKKGYNIGHFYTEDILSDNSSEINSNFENSSIQEIVNYFKKDLLLLENKFAQSEEIKEWDIGLEVENLINNINEECPIGLPVQGKIYNKIIDGAQLGSFTLRSSSSGLGKTRNAVADACFLAFPIRYSSVTCKWEQKGSNEKVLFIITEQTDRQIERMILAYITDINESKFKYGFFTDLEKKIIQQGIQIIKQYSDNFKLVRIPNPTIELIKSKVREKVILHNIKYVFYDYIFIGPALLNEFRGFGVRNDEVLLMMATALKDLAIELNVCVFSSTQVNANADDNTTIRNESSLAGGRSTINKADNGIIMSRPTKEELEILEPIISQYGKPNLVMDVFKVRSGEWTQVRIWSNADLGTMKREDLFITDENLNNIKDFYKDNNFEISNWEDEEYNTILRKVDELNGL